MLLARLAGALRGQPVPERRAALTEAVEIARRLGDPETLAYAIEGTYASISWPRDTDRWLSMATELRQIAGQLGDMEKVFSGHLHASVPSWCAETSRPLSSSSRRLTAVAHELRQPLQLWALTMVGVMRALQVGSFDEAEELAERARSFGSGHGGLADDTTFQYVSLFNEWALRRERGEVAEVRGSLERFVAEYPTFFLFRCMLVSTYSEAGEERRPGPSSGRSPRTTSRTSRWAPSGSSGRACWPRPASASTRLPTLRAFTKRSSHMPITW